MVALNVQCSMFNGESLFQLPWRVVVTAATIASVVITATGCLGFLGHDVGCNVLHFLSLLVQGKLLRVLGFALTFGRACSRSAVLKRVWHCSRLIAAFLCRDSA